jgi:class 3 adenylate cyclase/predicted ATPase
MAASMGDPPGISHSRGDSGASPPIVYTPRHLAERIRAEQVALEARGAPDGERKTITALFADIKGSMSLLEDLDPEEARRLIDPALQLMMEAVHRYEGYVAQSLGDGIFALFGAPIAHEDHAHRALYAALRMQEQIRRYADKLRLEGGVPIQIRVGLNTGEVVLRSIRTDDLRTDYVPIGHATSLAARMESLADPGTIVVTEPTYKLTEGYFAFNPLGAALVKGVSEPVPIYEVLGVGPLRTRLQVAARRGLVRFVGRQPELAQMQRAWEQAQRGQGQIVAVVGEPGVGKSRLCYEFKLLSQRDGLVLETFSVSHGKAYPYLPLIELLQHYFQIPPQDDERRRQEKVTGKVLTLDRRLEDALPYLGALLGCAEPAAALAQMDRQIKRRRTFEAISRVLLRESLNQPLFLLVEDLHWLDRETEAWLHLLSERVATARILLLVNYRPEYQHPWGSKTYYTQLRLDPLGREEAEALLTALLGESRGGVTQPRQGLKQLILAKTEGNPFFMEEIVQALVEQGVLVRDPGAGGVAFKPASTTTPLTKIQLPPTVQGVLAARIDRLGADEKALLQTLAVIGKEFSLSLLRYVVDKPEDELHQLLSHLQAAEFIYEQPAFPEPEYTFKHALTQEVAYNSVLLERRKGLHERAAQATETLFHERLEEHYSELAHHYRRSGNTEKAVEYLQRAGRQAMQRSAYAEAIGHLTIALELLKTLPDTPERIQQELVLQTALGPALMATKGYAAPEVEHAYARARELCQLVMEAPQVSRVLRGLRVFYFVRAEFQTARELGEQLLSLAERQHDPALLLEAHLALGGTLFYLGELTRARAHLEQGIAFYDSQPHRSHALHYGEDPGVGCRGFAARTLWHLGYPQQALQRNYEGLTLAQNLAHPQSLAFMLYHAAVVHQLRREGQLTQTRAEAVIALSSEQEFALFFAVGTVLRGWALAEQGQAEEGIAHIRQGLAAYRVTGAELGQPYILALLAEAYGNVGQTEEGLSALAEALALVNKTQERWWEAELYRLKGELLRRQAVGAGVNPIPMEASQWAAADGGATGRSPLLSEAEGCFQRALDVARHRQAKPLELRAAMSLGRLWQRQGRRQEAQQLVAGIYDWFTEGFDTADLREAKARLGELS